MTLRQMTSDTVSKKTQTEIQKETEKEGESERWGGGGRVYLCMYVKCMNQSAALINMVLVM